MTTTLNPPTPSLRPYQTEALERIEAAAARGVRRQLGVASTGAGKTILFVSLAKRMGVRTLILAHRDELITQAAEKVRAWWPEADLGVVKAQRNEVGARDVIVASIQSLSPARLAALGHFGLVVVDEAHRTRATSYGRVLDALRAGEVDGPLLLGVTATPDRADGQGLDAHYDEIVFNYDLLWLIRHHHLVDIRAVQVRLANLRLGNVPVRQGDWVEGKLGAAMTAANAPRSILKAWRKHASDRKTLIFMPTVATATEVAAEFVAAGIPAGYVSGAMAVEDRRRVLADFSAGRIQVLANCQLATEGYDEPSISCVVMGRPTKSRVFYAQAIGRGTRLYPGKTNLLVLDVVGNSERLDLCTTASLAGVEPAALRSRTLTQAVSDAAAAKVASSSRSAPDAALLDRDVNLFERRRATASAVATKEARPGVLARLRARRPKRSTVVVAQSGPDSWTVLTVDGDGRESILMAGVPRSLAEDIADDQIRAGLARARRRP